MPSGFTRRLRRRLERALPGASPRQGDARRRRPPLINFEEAVSVIADHKWSPVSEACKVTESLGRRLAVPFVAAFDSPPFSSSAMDGYAVSDADAPWRIVGTLSAGDGPTQLEAGQAMRIFTGAMLPQGTFAVLPQEDAVVNGTELAMAGPIRAGQFMRNQGEEFLSGTNLIPGHTKITPAVISVLAGQGACRVDVLSRPRIAILATGNELITPGSAYRTGAIYDSGTASLRTLLQGFSGSVTASHAIDDGAQTRDQMERLLEHSDLLVTIGGVSVGDFDFVRPAIEALGFEILFAGVAIRPGKPVSFGVRPDGKAWFGLPGNPMSAITTCCLFVLEFLGEPLRFAPSPLESNHKRIAGREEFVPARRTPAGVILKPTVGSHSISGWTEASGIARLCGEKTEFAIADPVPYADFPWRLT